MKQVLAEKKLIPIDGERSEYGSPEYEYAEKIKASGTWKFKEIRKPKKGEEPNAIIVCGVGMGKLVFAVPREDYKVTGRPAPAPVEKREKTVEEREDDLAAKRNKVALQKLLEHLRKADTVETWMKRGNLDAEAAHRVQLKHVMYFGLKGYYDRWGWITPKFEDEGKFAEKVFAFVKQRLQEIVTNELTKTLGDMNKCAVKDICDMLFLDLAEFVKAAEAEVPEPKSLIAARIKEKQAAREAAEKTTKPAKKARAKK